MPDFPSGLGGSITYPFGINLASSVGINVTSSGSVNTKGSYTELLASTPFAADGFILRPTVGGSGTRDFLIDIAIGAASSEIIIIPDLHLPSGTNAEMGVQIFCPIPIAAGSRISARCACSTATSSVQIEGTLLAGGFFHSLRLGRAMSYGFSAADSGGTSVDPGGSAHTKGSWAQLTAACDHAINALQVQVGNRANTTIDSNSNWLIDIGIGAGGSEVVIVENLHVRATSVADVVLPMSLGLFPIQVKAGTRLAARAQCGNTDATDRLIDVSVLAFD